MKLANVNNYEQAWHLFEEFNIPYEVITRGENKEKLREALKGKESFQSD